MKKSELMKSVFPLWCEQNGFSKPTLEHRFAPPRKFLFDYAWLDRKIAVECEGGIFTGQAHGSVSGILRDIEKYNLASANGWTVLRQIPDKLCSSEMLELMRMTFKSKAA